VSGDHLSDDIPIVVAAYSKEDGKRTIVHHTTLHEPGPYELIAPVGTHNVVAFCDKNKNLIYDKEEPAGQILKAEQVSVPAGGVSGRLDIILSVQNANELDLPSGFKIPPKKYNNFHSTCPGAMADLEDFLFSDEYGKKGFWNPLEFFMEISGNIYFLEEYDPAKIPILFVHGASGSPQNWRTFFQSIDRNKYQPWFYYYPSGNSINSMSHLLLWKLENLQLKYKFKELYITAHSMGGLVVRSFLVNHGHYFPLVTNFISISTPWGGEKLAESGVKYSPAVIPAWIDMQSDGEFITSLFKKKMPPGVKHYLFFGIRLIIFSQLNMASIFLHISTDVACGVHEKLKLWNCVSINGYRYADGFRFKGRSIHAHFIISGRKWPVLPACIFRPKLDPGYDLFFVF